MNYKLCDHHYSLVLIRLLILLLPDNLSDGHVGVILPTVLGFLATVVVVGIAACVYVRRR